MAGYEQDRQCDKLGVGLLLGTGINSNIVHSNVYNHEFKKLLIKTKRKLLRTGGDPDKLIVYKYEQAANEKKYKDITTCGFYIGLPIFSHHLRHRACVITPIEYSNKISIVLAVAQSAGTRDVSVTYVGVLTIIGTDYVKVQQCCIAIGGTETFTAQLVNSYECTYELVWFSPAGILKFETLLYTAWCTTGIDDYFDGLYAAVHKVICSPLDSEPVPLLSRTISVSIDTDCRHGSQSQWHSESTFNGDVMDFLRNLDMWFGTCELTKNTKAIDDDDDDDPDRPDDDVGNNERHLNAIETTLVFVFIQLFHPNTHPITMSSKVTLLVKLLADMVIENDTENSVYRLTLVQDFLSNNLNNLLPEVHLITWMTYSLTLTSTINSIITKIDNLATQDIYPSLEYGCRLNAALTDRLRVLHTTPLYTTKTIAEIQGKFNKLAPANLYNLNATKIWTDKCTEYVNEILGDEQILASMIDAVKPRICHDTILRLYGYVNADWKYRIAAKNDSRLNPSSFSNIHTQLSVKSLEVITTPAEQAVHMAGCTGTPIRHFTCLNKHKYSTVTICPNGSSMEQLLTHGGFLTGYTSEVITNRFDYRTIILDIDIPLSTAGEGKAVTEELITDIARDLIANAEYFLICLKDIVPIDHYVYFSDSINTCTPHGMGLGEDDEADEPMYSEPMKKLGFHHHLALPDNWTIKRSAVTQLINMLQIRANIIFRNTLTKYGSIYDTAIYGKTIDNRPAYLIPPKFHSLRSPGQFKSDTTRKLIAVYIRTTTGNDVTGFEACKKTKIPYTVLFASAPSPGYKGSVIVGFDNMKSIDDDDHLKEYSKLLVDRHSNSKGSSEYVAVIDKFNTFHYLFHPGDITDIVDQLNGLWMAGPRQAFVEFIKSRRPMYTYEGSNLMRLDAENSRIVLFKGHLRLVGIRFSEKGQFGFCPLTQHSRDTTKNVIIYVNAVDDTSRLYLTVKCFGCNDNVMSTIPLVEIKTLANFCFEKVHNQFHQLIAKIGDSGGNLVIVDELVSIDNKITVCQPMCGALDRWKQLVNETKPNSDNIRVKIIEGEESVLQGRVFRVANKLEDIKERAALTTFIVQNTPNDFVGYLYLYIKDHGIAVFRPKTRNATDCIVCIIDRRPPDTSICIRWNFVLITNTVDELLCALQVYPELNSHLLPHHINAIRNIRKTKDGRVPD